jgi:hypothetical protein
MSNNKMRDSVALMLSEDYKERFIAEYIQLVCRRDKLKSMIRSWEKGTLAFTPKSKINVLYRQILIMNRYILVLRKRAVDEGINLDQFEE